LKDKFSNRFVFVVVAGLRDLDWDGELIGRGILERDCRVSSFNFDEPLGDRMVWALVLDGVNAVCILSGSGIE
jgi:hypothetical protein